MNVEVLCIYVLQGDTIYDKPTLAVVYMHEELLTSAINAYNQGEVVKNDNKFHTQMLKFCNFSWLYFNVKYFT